MQQPEKNSNATDDDLMAAYRDGDLGAFEVLYQRYRKVLFQFILNSCDSKAIASDLYQDVWTRVINARHGYTESASFPAWIFRIARNRLIDHYRTNSKHTAAMPLDEQVESQVTQLQTRLQPDELADLSARKDALKLALNALPDEQREVVLLRHIAGFSVQEIAELLQENTETVKSRLRYAFAKLRKRLRLLI